MADSEPVALQVAPAVLVAALALGCIGSQGADDIEDERHDSDEEEELDDATQEGEGHDEGGHDGEAKGRAIAVAAVHRGSDHGGTNHHVVHSG